MLINTLIYFRSVTGCDLAPRADRILRICSHQSCFDRHLSALFSSWVQRKTRTTRQGGSGRDPQQPPGRRSLLVHTWQAQQRQHSSWLWFSATHCCSAPQRSFCPAAGSPAPHCSPAAERSSSRLPKRPWQRGPGRTVPGASYPFSPGAA